MSLYFEDVVVGEELPDFRRKGDLESWNRFAAANDEFMPPHMDLDAAMARGEKEIFGSGNLRFAQLHCLLRSWMGDDGLVRHVKCQHRGILFKNEVAVAKGRVEATRVAGGEHLVDLALWTENERGERLDEARATVSLPTRNKAPGAV